MRFEFTYTPEDLADLMAIIRLNPTPVPVNVRNRMALGWVIFIALAALLFYFLRNTQPRAARGTSEMTPTMVWSAAGALGVFVVLAVIGSIYARKSPAWMFKENPELQDRQTLTIDDNGVTLATPNTSSTWSWHAFVRVTHGKRILALKLSGPVEKHVMIPLRAVPVDQLETLKSMLKQRIQPPTGAFPVIAKDGVANDEEQT